MKNVRFKQSSLSTSVFLNKTSYHSKYYNTVQNGYNDIGYSDRLDIVTICQNIPCPHHKHFIHYVLHQHSPTKMIRTKQ